MKGKLPHVPMQAWIGPPEDYGREQYLAIVSERGNRVGYMIPDHMVEQEAHEKSPDDAPIEIMASGLGQSLMNKLWEYGYRPTGVGELSETMTATRKHLEDMRALAFHKVGAPKP